MYLPSFVLLSLKAHRFHLSAGLQRYNTYFVIGPSQLCHVTKMAAVFKEGEWLIYISPIITISSNLVLPRCCLRLTNYFS